MKAYKESQEQFENMGKPVKTKSLKTLTVFVVLRDIDGETCELYRTESLDAANTFAADSAYATRIETRTEKIAKPTGRNYYGEKA